MELLKCHIPEFKLEFMIKWSKYTFIVAISIETLCVIKFKKKEEDSQVKKNKNKSLYSMWISLHLL